MAGHRDVDAQFEGDPEDVLTRQAEWPDAVLRYADHRDGLIDVFLPASLGRPTEPARLLVLVHGGFWRQRFDRTHLYPMANALIRRGFVVALPEFRRTGGEGGWPQTAEDVADALATVAPMVHDVAPGQIDPEHPAIVSGHSAGGHLALWAGLRAPAGSVSRIVALAPVSDLVFAAHHQLGAGAARELMGGPPEDMLDEYAEADGYSGLAVQHDVEYEHPAITVIHGTADDTVPVTVSRAAATKHPRITYVELDGVGHFALIDPLSDVFASAVLPALTADR